MSIVNQAEKDGILYDINDARVYTVDLGTLTLTPDDPDNPKSFSGNTTLTAEQFLNLQNSEIGFIKFTFNGTNIITTVNENLDYPEVTGLVTASTSIMMGGSFSAISVVAQYEGTLGETVPTQVIVVLDILPNVSGGTQLYKHMAKIYAIGDYDPEYIHLMLISWLDTSFEGLHWKELNGKYIGAFVVEDRGGEDWITQVITIVNDNDNVQVVAKNQYNNDMVYTPDWDSEYSCYIIEDTITQL